MGGLAPEPEGACFVQGPPVLVLRVAFVIKKNVFRGFMPIVFFSERAFAIAIKVPMRQSVKLFTNKKENRGGSCAVSGQTWPVFSSKAKLVLGKARIVAYYVQVILLLYWETIF